MTPMILIGRAIRAIITRRPPDVCIGGDGTVDGCYMVRWWVIPRRLLPFNVYLHKFQHSDDDRALHDHPWWSVSCLVEGEYIEETFLPTAVPIELIRQYNMTRLTGRTLRRAGDIAWRRAESAHRIELPGKPCWTIFITGPVIREWGFHCLKGWVHNKEFGEGGTTYDDKGRPIAFNSALAKGCGEP